VAIVWLGRRSELWVRFGGKSFYRDIKKPEIMPRLSIEQRANCESP
jgi:hypothetical protein